MDDQGTCESVARELAAQIETASYSEEPCEQFVFHDYALRNSLVDFAPDLLQAVLRHLPYEDDNGLTRAQLFRWLPVQLHPAAAKEALTRALLAWEELDEACAVHSSEVEAANSLVIGGDESLMQLLCPHMSQFTAFERLCIDLVDVGHRPSAGLQMLCSLSSLKDLTLCKGCATVPKLQLAAVLDALPKLDLLHIEKFPLKTFSPALLHGHFTHLILNECDWTRFCGLPRMTRLQRLEVVSGKKIGGIVRK